VPQIRPSTIWRYINILLTLTFGQKWLLNKQASTMMLLTSMQFIVASIAKILAEDNENWRNPVSV